MEYTTPKKRVHSENNDTIAIKGIKDRYKQFRLTLLLVITVFSLIPASIMAVVGYFQYLALLESQEATQLRWHINYTKDKIEEFISNNIVEPPPIITAHFEQLLIKVNMNVLDDTFLIDKQGTILTHSSFYPNMSSVPFPVDPENEDFIQKHKTLGVGKTLIVTSPILDSPWLLVLIKDGPIHKKEWYNFQLKLITVFIACTAISLVVIYQLVNLLTYRIRLSDIKRMTLFSEIGHTNRLATIGRLAAGVAHEINNPLAVIDQKAGLLEDYLEFSEDFANKDKFLQTLKGINNNVNRCKKITHRLLGFARKVEAKHEPIDINSLIKEVLGFLEKEALYNHIQLNLNLEEKLPIISSDHGQLQQIFLNIINNAIDAIGQNGEISITSSLAKKGFIQIDIKDNGPGIEPAVMKHIFDPFFTTKDTGKGTGLGLAITYGLLTKLGGDIKVASVLNTGTTFSISLPVTKDSNQNKGAT